MRMTTEEIVELAKKHVDRLFDSGADCQSALTCLHDAFYALRHGNPALAKLKAVKSLAHSVGIFHEDYQRAIE